MVLDNRFPITTKSHVAQNGLFRRPYCLLLIALAWTFGSSNPALAGFSVEISVNGGIPTVYPDNVAPDLNPAVGDIEIDFTVSDAMNTWTANGTVLASGGLGTPPVSTIVTDTLIEKLMPGLINGEIAVKHNYAASGIAMHDAMIDGQFENTLGNSISYAELFYTATVNIFDLGTAHEGPAASVPGPVPFGDTLGPITLLTTTEHLHTLSFYLDAPGDAIRLFNSAEIHTFVLEPATLVLVGACLSVGIFMARRRKAEILDL